MYGYGYGYGTGMVVEDGGRMMGEAVGNVVVHS